MKITLLCENTTSLAGAKNCLAEWGFSAFIELDGVNLLFDTGHTDVYIKNAKKLKIDLNETDFVVLSHDHWDHTGGLNHHPFTKSKKLIGHPELFKKLLKKKTVDSLDKFEIISSEKYLEFSKNVFYLGEIPRIINFEKGFFDSDEMRDDSAIAIKTSKGAIVITGCSHSGICNICEYAKKITKQEIYAVIGGFHLFEDDKNVVDKTIEYFKNEKIKHLMPMHCVDFPTQVKMSNELNFKKYSTGDVIEL